MKPAFLQPEVLPSASVVIIPAGATICAYCPDWLPAVPGASHGMCAACAIKFEKGGK
jgi:hypothetical protein